MIRTDWGDNPAREKKGAYGGVTYYRLHKPAEALRKLGHTVDIYGKELEEYGTYEEQLTHIFTNYDIVITKQVDNYGGASGMIAASNYFKKPLIVDLDDNHLKVPKANPASSQYAKGTEKRSIVAAYLGMASGLIVSTEPLKEEYLRLNNNITVIPNMNDINDWSDGAKIQKDTITLGYMGSITHNADLKLIIPAVAEVMRRHDNVRFLIIGALTDASATKLFEKYHDVTDRVEIMAGTPTWNGYAELIAKSGIDIGLAPLVNDDFNRGKSHIKWMEYAMIGVPTIASRVYPYYKDIQGKKTIQHLETGMLAKNKKDWVSSIEYLINEENRKRIADNAYAYIKENWQYEGKQWETTLKGFI